MEAQSSGLPAIVADEGGPKETVAHDVSGIVLPASDPDLWVSTISRLLDDEPTRARFSRSALTRSARYSLAKTFEHFFAEHAKLLGTQTVDEPKPQPITEYAERVLG
jgi:glycosyltransferase involved in cell wall biosynthesis